MFICKSLSFCKSIVIFALMSLSVSVCLTSCASDTFSSTESDFSLASDESIISEETAVSEVLITSEDSATSEVSVASEEVAVSEATVPSEEATISEATVLSEDAVVSEATAVSEEVAVSEASVAVEESQEAVVGEDYYSDNNVSIMLHKIREYNTDVYIADIIIKDISYLKTAFAGGTLNSKTAKTSATASANGAIFAINGDFCGARKAGYVIRNGVLFREKAFSSSREGCVIYNDGTLKTYTEGSLTAEELMTNGACHCFSFGPALIDDYLIAVDFNQEVSGKSMTSNPRTAIGMVAPLHYIFAVSDGRTDVSEGLSLFNLALVMQKYGVVEAYNLDGGGSSTMWFNGNIVNFPTTKGKLSERSVSDIIMITP